MEDAPRNLWKECPHIWANIWILYVSTCTVTRFLASCGKDNLRKFYRDLDGKSTELGMSFCSSETMIVLIGKRG